MSISSKYVRRAIPLFFSALGLLAFATGCGDGQFPVRAAKGKVVSNGQPVTTGSATFTPVGEEGKLEAGKPATAAVGPDGTFILTTNKRFDGAIVGKHRVNYMGPEGEEEEQVEDIIEGSAQERAKNLELVRKRRAEKKMQFAQKGEIIVEVKDDGENDFTIEVAPAAR